MLRSSTVDSGDGAVSTIIEALNKEKGVSCDPMLVDVLIEIIGETDYRMGERL